MQQRARVLVVDDERFFREAITEVMEREGIETVLAATGEEALDRSQDTSVGVVILDLQLPDLHGMEVFRRLRDLRPELKVVILSAHTDQEFVLEALRLGAFDYLAKPLHEEELSIAVRRALETYGMAAGWSGLRGRLGRLEKAVEELWVRAGEDEDEAGLREVAVQAAAEVLGAAKTSLMLVDDEEGALRVAAAHGRKLPPEEMDAVPLGQGVAGVALARSEPILVSNAREDERFAGRASDRYDSDSFAVAPLVAGSKTLGVLCATDRGDEPFDTEDLALLRILSRQVAQMLAPAAPDPFAGPTEVRVVDERAQEMEPEVPAVLEVDAPAPDREAELARAICDAVTAEVEPARILEAALRPIASTLRAAPVSLYLLDPESGALVAEAVHDGGARGDRARLEPGRGLTGTVLESGTLVATDHADADPRFDQAVDSPDGGPAGPLLSGPLRFRGRILGLFRAYPQDPQDAEPRTGEVISAALSAAVRNVLLYRSLVDTIEEVAEARRQARGPR